MKTLRSSAVIVAMGLLLGSCAPANVAPPGAIGYGNGFLPFASTPLAARAHEAADTALGLRVGPEGFGFQVTDGAWARS